MTLDTVIVWRTPAGNINVTTVFENMRLPSESDTELLNREVQKQISLNPRMGLCQHFFKTKYEVRAITNSVVGGKRKRKIDPFGNITIDNSIETPNEAQRRLEGSIKSKLNAFGLTNEEVKFILAN